MKVIITNDDGIFSHSLWTLVEAFKKVAEVVVVAPASEQSACGTSVTLRSPIKVKNTIPLFPGVRAYAVDGTPSDSTIFALGNFPEDRYDYVISGINQGANLGDDVLISGTVSAAMQGYLRGVPSIAVSVTEMDSSHYKHAAELAALLAVCLKEETPRNDILLNINYPDLPKEKVKGLCLSTLAHKTHIDTVKPIKGENCQDSFQLIRKRLSKEPSKGTDVHAILHGYASVTEIHSHMFKCEPLPISQPFYDRVFQKFLLI